VSTVELSSVVADAEALIRIRTPNPPGAERTAAEWVARRLEGIATDLRIQAVSADRANLLAVFDFGPGPTVMLCTHLDVVPPQGEHQWEPELRDGRLHGRGACDAKGALASMIAACERVRASRSVGLQGRLILAAVADEELGATGIQTMLGSGVTADAAVIGEPTDNLPVLSSRGAVRLMIRFAGRSAHAGAPANGTNAIYPAARLALAIEAYNLELAANGSLGSCAATVINGGSAVNVIPGDCLLQIDRRLGPNETPSTAACEIETMVAAAASKESRLAYEIQPAGVWLEPISVSESSPFARMILEAVGQPRPGPVFMAGTDAPHLIRAGIPTAILGPGSLALAHSADESIAVGSLAQATEAYERVVRTVLGAPYSRSLNGVHAAGGTGRA
jgi:acetylornithine deacetylase/succinyl-diaminopimelate desuccinylase-like protein